MSKLDELLARIKADVVIRRSKSGNVVADTGKQRQARAERDARSSDPALTGLMRQANVDAKRLSQKQTDPYAGWKELARLSLLQKQICRCCGAAQINVAGEMIHLRGYPSPEPGISKVDVWIRRSSVADLPYEDPLWAPTQSVAHCYECLQAFLNCGTPSTQSVPEETGQLPLLH